MTGVWIISLMLIFPGLTGTMKRSVIDLLNYRISSKLSFFIERF